MSVVTDIVILASSDEEAPDGHWAAFAAINQWLQYRLNAPVELLRLNDAAGGSKAHQCEIWSAALNHLPLDEFLAMLIFCPWEAREQVQVLCKREDDDVFTLHTLCSHYGPTPPQYQAIFTGNALKQEQT